MVARPVTVLICIGFFMILQAFLPKGMALRNPSDVDRFLNEGHRTHRRKNYIVQRARDDEDMGNIENKIANEVERYEPERNPEELSAFIVDYANMIRNDVILLDKSVETRTRKRGNIKVKKYNQAISDPPCKCKPHRTFLEFGDTAFPQRIEIRNCSKSDSCIEPFRCINDKYNLTILRRKEDLVMEQTDIKIHKNLETNWYAEQLQISVGCYCSSNYIT